MNARACACVRALYAIRYTAHSHVRACLSARERLRGSALALNLRIILSRAFAESFEGNSMRELCPVVHF
jgi:hypothetical protein